MRIIAGSKKGHSLLGPRGAFTRPTADRVREAIFNILGPLSFHARVLDLFAGTGALGLESLSRDGKEVVFVEEDLSACRCILKNAVTLGFESSCVVKKGSVEKILPSLQGPFHLVFIDPPYLSTHAENTLCLLEINAHRLLAPSAIVVVEHMKKPKQGQLGLKSQYGECLFLIDTRNYGQTGVSFYEYRESIHPKSGSISGNF